MKVTIELRAVIGADVLAVQASEFSLTDQGGGNVSLRLTPALRYVATNNVRVVGVITAGEQIVMQFGNRYSLTPRDYVTIGTPSAEQEALWGREAAEAEAKRLEAEAKRREADPPSSITAGELLDLLLKVDRGAEISLSGYANLTIAHGGERETILESDE